MLTTWQQVEDWIRDNGFKRWILYRDRSRNEKIVDSMSFPSELEDKLQMTEKYLRLTGGSAYAAGGTSGTQSDLTTVCEIRLAEQQPTAGISGQNIQPLNIGEIEERVRKQVKAEIAAENYARDKAQFEKDKKAFEEEKQSALGALIHYFAPIGQQLIAKGLMRNVAGVDTAEPVHAQPIVAEPQPKEEKPEADPDEKDNQELVDMANDFTDEEGEKLTALMSRFKKVEPQYMELIEAVVEMAERGDSTYTMAKGFLIKG